MIKSKLIKSMGMVSLLLLSSCALINATSVKELEISTLPNNTTFEVGQMLSLKGMTVVDKATKEIIADYETTPHEGYSFKNEDVGHYKVTVSKETYKSAEFTVNVVNKELLIISSPSKTSYKTGEAFSLSGLKVIDRDTMLEVTDYTSSLVEGKVFGISDIGVITVNIFKPGYVGTSFTIEVSNSDETVKIVDIYATNDIHGQIEEQNNRASVDKVMTYLKGYGDQPNTLLLDQGDTWQGSIYSNSNHGALITDLMNYVKYDARTIGNHDFDWGADYVTMNADRSYNGYKTPVLGANIYDYDFATRVVGEKNYDFGIKTVSYTLENGLKVGIVGCIGEEQITSITTSYVQNLTFIDQIQVIKEEATRLKTEENCNIVISCNHCDEDDVKGNDLSNYVDLVLCAHSHQNEQSQENGLLFAQFGGYNQSIGHIQLAYNSATGEVSYPNVESISGSYINSKVTTIEPTIQQITELYKQDYEEEAKEVVASNVSGSFYGSGELANVMCKAIYQRAIQEGFDVDLAFCNNGRASLYSNVWTYADIYQAFPFDNRIYIIEASPDEMRDEVGGHNYVYRSPSFSGKIEYDRIYRIACIDYLAFHTNSSRHYDYFPDNAGKSIGKLTYNYREILRSFLINEGYDTGKLLSSSDFSSDLTSFSRNFY